MERGLENKLFHAIFQDNHESIKLLLSQGANPNEVVCTGKTCIGEAVFSGKISILKILLDHYVTAERKPNKPLKRKLNANNKKQLSPKRFVGYNFNSGIPKELDGQHPCTSTGERGGENNRGYYVFIHDDDSSMEDSNFNYHRPGALCMTPSPQADLEWDENIGDFAAMTSEDETWSSMYKWYAEILESTGSAWESTVPCGIDQQDTFSKTALHYAVEKQDITALKLLLDSGCKLDIPADKGMTPLHVATSNNYRDVVEILLIAGSRVNQKTDDKVTALHLAASKGHLEIIQRLVKAGANLEARDTSERTSLYLAAKAGHESVVKLLITLGANVNTEEIHGFTPLCEAILKNHLNVIEILIQSGARISHTQKLLHRAIIQRQVKVVKLLTMSTSVINRFNEAGMTPLHCATKTSQRNICKLLLEKGANINLCNHLTGASVLHIAVDSIKKPRDFELFFKLFLQYKINLNIVAFTNDTALHRALIIKRDHAATLLIKHGADVNMWDLKLCGLDNLSIASRRCSPNLGTLLIKAGYRVVNKNFTGPKFTVRTLTRACSMPLKLKDQCRIQIRRSCMNGILSDYVNSLSLPKSLKSFLMLEYL